MFVRNKERSEKFYGDILGLTVMNRTYRATFMSANEDTSHEIALVEVGEDAPGPERGRVGLNHMAWQMGTFEDLKEVYRKLKSNDVEITRVSDHNLSIGVYFKDPDGNECEAYYELPKDQWERHPEKGLFGTQYPRQLEDRVSVAGD
jgi:catechol-2,3-dioxygenase